MTYLKSKLLHKITKETINKMKRQLTDWEKVFATNVIYKGLVSKIHQQFMRLNSITTNNPVKNGQKT